MTDAPPLTIDYPALVREALRTVVRSALDQTAAEGLAPPHQLYLTFRTEAPGVELPGFLREAYADTMTIVLENQFWGLEVDDDQFRVTLRFAGTPHRLAVPFAALTAFVDPGAEFGLRFEESGDEREDDAGDAEEKRFAERPETARPSAEGDAAVVDLASFRRRRPRDADQ